MLDPLNIAKQTGNLSSFNNRDFLIQPKNSPEEFVSTKIAISFPVIQYFLILWDIPTLFDYLNKFIISIKDVYSFEFRPLRKFVANLVLFVSHMDLSLRSVHTDELDFSIPENIKQFIEPIISEYVKQLINFNQVPLVKNLFYF